ncbi:hypothetical protein TWF192_010879 [Orbilia oligospora]|nr:hypothetical protein TWF192_010879 [Orbilia oligospora]
MQRYNSPGLVELSPSTPHQVLQRNCRALTSERDPSRVRTSIPRKTSFRKSSSGMGLLIDTGRNPRINFHAIDCLLVLTYGICGPNKKHATLTLAY